MVVTSDGVEKKQKAIANIGKIPSGLPAFTVGWWAPLYDVGKQMVLAVLICFIDICESISIAKALAQVGVLIRGAAGRDQAEGGCCGCGSGAVGRGN